MVPYDDFTPHGYLDNIYHCWKLNPSGVLRSRAPLGMGWHVPNLGSYARNQFQYGAHLAIGLKVGDMTLVTPQDFERNQCRVVSHLHTKHRFEYTCQVPQYNLTLRARYLLVAEHALGCTLTLSTTGEHPLPVTCYLMHLHTHNPATSRLWEHGLYAINGPEDGSALLGLASEGDAFIHGARSVDGRPLMFGEMKSLTSLEDVSAWACGVNIPSPSVTQSQPETGWQMRSVVVPCDVTLGSDGGAREQVINLTLARGVSPDQSYHHWKQGMEQLASIEAAYQIEDEVFWQQAPQLSGDWPAHWRRGLVYDLETLRMVTRPAVGSIQHRFDGMQIQAPRLVLAEAAMDALCLSYADPAQAAEVILGHFASAPHPNLPCMREDGSYNMVADDGQICGTAPEWGFPVWCCDQLVRRSGDMSWLRRLYPGVAAYLRWWLEHRRDAEGWLVYVCSWESGQDVSLRFGFQQTGGTNIQRIRPVDLQASMAQGAEIVARWAEMLASAGPNAGEIDCTAEAAWWRAIADEFTIRTRQLWHDGWFRDYDSSAQAWSSQQDTMHLAPVFCGAAGWGHIEQLRSAFAQPPRHGSWAPLSWPPVVMTLVEAADAAQVSDEAAELAYTSIDAAYRGVDSREVDAQGGLPGITREYLGESAAGTTEAPVYVNAGIEGYGWGAISIHLLIRYLLGLRAEEAGKITIAPFLPRALRREGAAYRIAPLPWGAWELEVECVVEDAERYRLHLRCRHQQVRTEQAVVEDGNVQETEGAQEYEWRDVWGKGRTLLLPQFQRSSPS